VTRKHFKAIAEILRVYRLNAQNDYDYDFTVQNTINEIACKLADYFKFQNSRFDRVRFLKAAAPTSRST